MHDWCYEAQSASRRHQQFSKSHNWRSVNLMLGSGCRSECARKGSINHYEASIDVGWSTVRTVRNSSQIKPTQTGEFMHTCTFVVKAILPYELRSFEVGRCKNEALMSVQLGSRIMDQVKWDGGPCTAALKVKSLRLLCLEWWNFDYGQDPGWLSAIIVVRLKKQLQQIRGVSEIWNDENSMYGTTKPVLRRQLRIEGTFQKQRATIQYHW